MLIIILKAAHTYLIIRSNYPMHRRDVFALLQTIEPINNNKHASFQLQAAQLTWPFYHFNPVELIIMFRIKINDKLDAKLLENFPNDPYHDVTVVTQSNTLELSLAFLSIDSNFFANAPSHFKEVDLSHLNEQPLLHVLRALYGGELEASTIPEL